MARMVTPSSPAELMDTPFIEFGVRMSEVDKMFYGEGISAYTHKSAGMPFIGFCQLLNNFLKGSKLLEGEPRRFAEMVALIKLHRYTEALEKFTEESTGFTIQLPWIDGFVDPDDSEPWRSYQTALGTGIAMNMKDVLEGNASQAFGNYWLQRQKVRVRAQVCFKPVSGSTPVRATIVNTDLWFPELEQGLRLTAERKLVELSDTPLGENMKKIDASGVQFVAARSQVVMRHFRSDMTLCGNILYNAILTYIAARMSSLGDFKPDDPFFTEIQSNVPMGAYFGQNILTPGLYEPPVVALHNTPGDLYRLLRNRFPGGSNLRQQGVFAAPSRTAKQTGTAANLALVGKKGTSSYRKQAQGFLLYDRETASTLKEALNVGDSTFFAHTMFEEYCEWYREKRQMANRILTKMGEPTEKWGKWDFNPWQFAKQPGSARLYFRIIEEDK